MYYTKKRQLLYDFFLSHPHDSFTAKQIYSAIASTNSQISLSAIYRNLEMLKNDGVVQCSLEKENQISYRYVQADKCKDHLHMTCLKCGKTFHMQKNVCEDLQQQLYTANGFTVDKTNTTIFGVCKHCNK